ncbi:hypothetical protein Tco_0039219 [Tanacetum coccineum]
MQIVTTTKNPEDEAAETPMEQEPEITTRAVPISTVRPITRPNPEVALIESSSRPPFTNNILEIPIPQPNGLVINIMPLEPQVIQRAGKGIATSDEEFPQKLVPASTIIFNLTNDEIQEYLNKEEEIKKKAEEAKLLAMTKSEIIKVVHEEAKKAKIDPKLVLSAKGGEQFKKIYDAEHQVHKRQHTKKTKKAMKLRKKRLEQYIVTELDELGLIIKKKKNKIVGELMISLGKRYERLRKIPEDLGIQSSLLAPKQAPSQSSGRKRKHMELEPEIKVPRLECNRSLPKGVPFVKNMVIEEPKYGMFFIDVFGDQSFQRMSDINKIRVDSLLTYLMMASIITIPENTRFCLKLRKLIAEYLDQEKL